jgi:hypothetical protein
LAFDILGAGVELAESVPVMIINEPIFISQGANSDIRYNFFYPRWAYDDYREILYSMAERYDWHYFDLWDSISPEAFTNTAIHINAEASEQLANMIGDKIVEVIEK